ncbi:MAG: SDR family NAD(P)-dependent oxidoreductase [Saprospiraceae bacterium]|nr:SDR family NAD(P)-dependent oxidoreductase [Saprospiraceae bacterium]
MAKYALVTGVLGGIGSVISRKLKESGYYVYGLDVRDDFDYKCDRFILFDINQFVVDSSYRIRFTEIFNNLIPNLDLLVNNAAVQRLDSLDNLKIEEWSETLNVNLTGPLLLSKLFLKRLEESKGSIINIGSIHERLTKKRFISYATSKSALVGLTRAMAVDLEGRVRVNAVSPAAIETKMLLDGFDNNEEKVKELEALHPVQRIGYPEDVAKLVLFLASENNGFIHGANISLDGGISSVLKDL